jgi:hypothetical protein
MLRDVKRAHDRPPATRRLVCAARARAEAVRQSGALGGSKPLLALFDFLLGASRDRRAPKEQEIAIEVFGRDPRFDPVQDAVVRVYVHKLRKALAAIAVAPGEPRLALPRGQYQLVLLAAEEPQAEAIAASPPPMRPRSRRAVLAAAGLLVALAASFTTWAIMAPPAELREVDDRAQSPWAALLDNGLPTVIVLGDYYLLGESDDGMEVSRLVREFDINSTADLNAYLPNNPDKMERYVDMDLRYLPVSAGLAVSRVSAVVGRLADHRRLSVIAASQLTPEMIKTQNIVYIGYFSGLRSLARLFAASRFVMGGSFDEIVDSRTGRRFVSQATRPRSLRDLPGLWTAFGVSRPGRQPHRRNRRDARYGVAGTGRTRDARRRLDRGRRAWAGAKPTKPSTA